MSSTTLFLLSQLVLLRTRAIDLQPGCEQWQQICPGEDSSWPAYTENETQWPSGNNWGCLERVRMPMRFLFKVRTGGSLSFNMSARRDIDYALYGPFDSVDDLTTSCGSYGPPISCSFSGSPTEYFDITNFEAGKAYAWVISNFARAIQNFTLKQTGGNAEIDCAPINIYPTLEPTAEPTFEPTLSPDQTYHPTVEPTFNPTSVPTPEPTEEPTQAPTSLPPVEPTDEPTSEPTSERANTAIVPALLLPTIDVTGVPTPEPTEVLLAAHDGFNYLWLLLLLIPCCCLLLAALLVARRRKAKPNSRMKHKDFHATRRSAGTQKASDLTNLLALPDDEPLVGEDDDPVRESHIGGHSEHCEHCEL